MASLTKRSPAPQSVTVNDAVISSAEIAREAQNHGSGRAELAWEAATRALVVRELLSQRAAALQLVAEPRSENGLRETEEEALIRMLLETEVKTPTAGEEECLHYYRSNLIRFRSPDLYEPRHILFKMSQKDAVAFALAVDRAEAVLNEVKAAPDSFEDLARAVSDCPSAAEGGRLGQIARGDTTAEFELALTSLAPGEIYPEVVRTGYGVHVIRLDRKVEGTVMPFEQVHERIARYLEASSSRRAAAQYVALLVGQARISGFTVTGATSPLVQ